MFCSSASQQAYRKESPEEIKGIDSDPKRGFSQKALKENLVCSAIRQEFFYGNLIDL
jgi:hypothetical protein